jgi:hypothetical protein
MTKSPFNILPTQPNGATITKVVVPLVVPAPTAKNGVVKEHGGQSGPEPTRFGDWEKAGRCTDF